MTQNDVKNTMENYLLSLEMHRLYVDLFEVLADESCVMSALVLKDSLDLSSSCKWD